VPLCRMWIETVLNATMAELWAALAAAPKD